MGSGDKRVLERELPLAAASVFRPEAFRPIRAVATDVDGVLTDGTFLWGVHGEELKRFCFADVTGFALARASGIFVALISGESSPDGMALVQRYADKLGIVDVFKGCHDKAAALHDFAAAHQIGLAETCFIGDDLMDLPAMAAAGIGIAPADAQPGRAGPAFLRDQGMWRPRCGPRGHRPDRRPALVAACLPWTARSSYPTTSRVSLSTKA